MTQVYPSLLNVKRPKRCTLNATMRPVLYSKVLAVCHALGWRETARATKRGIGTLITLRGG